MSGPLISAAIIVRDEAEFLRRCLASIVGWCDEIVVVDTGSTDHTVEVARSFGAVIGSFPWIDDFAAARNEALRLATGRWILYIDADEQFDAVDPAAAHEELLRNDDAVALRIKFRYRPMLSPYREYRMWKHRDDIRFFGRIHETMVPDILRVSEDEGLEIRDSDVFGITHFGYEGDMTPKCQRNLPLLEQRVIECADRVYLWSELGNTRLALGDSGGAIEAWLTGIELMRARGIGDHTDALCYIALAQYLVDRGDDVEEWIDEMAAMCPWALTRHMIEAKHFRQLGLHEQSIEPLRTLIAIGPDPISDSLGYHNDMFTHWAWETLADSLMQLGDLAGAAEVFATASEACPDRLDYRSKSVALSSMALKLPSALVAG